MDFTNFNLSESLMKGINHCRFIEPTKVQLEVIPAILQGRDVVVKAKTGSGKTGAFAIPILEKTNTLESSPSVLVLTPTRELAEQVQEEISKFSLYKDLKSIAVYGKKPIQAQINALKSGVNIVVGTPGRVTDLIIRDALKLENIDFFVLDEADELLNRGFFDDVINIIDLLKKPHQTLLFSATMPKEIQELCKLYIKEPHWVEIAEEAPDIKELNYYVKDEWKFLRFRQVITSINPFTCLIFCNTRNSVDDLYNRMRQVGIKPLRLHGGMKQKDRLKTIKSFREGNVQCLLATDLVARGIHIDSLDLVVNYDVPQIMENYVHRIGRTGRVGETGKAVTFFTSSDTEYKLELEEYLNRNLNLIEFDDMDFTDIELSKSEKQMIDFEIVKDDQL